jgi:transposase InsO family protein
MGQPREWYWDFNKFEIAPPEHFNREIESVQVCYALVLAQVTDAPNRRRKRALTAFLRTAQTPAEGLQALLDQYRDVLDPGPVQLSKPCEGVSHRIETFGEPPHGPIYNLSQRELKALREYLEEATALGYIRPSESPAGAPILFVPKSDGTLRLCVDYRGLNKVTRKNRHPLPLISEILDRLAGAKIFSKLDLVSAYHRIPIHHEDVWKTAFRTRYGHFEYMVMPFGLTNAPATFQSWINKALAGYIDDFVIVYLDDILIFSSCESEHREHLGKVLNRLRQYALYCKLSKCQFFQNKVEFLGYIVTPGGVRMDESRVETIKDWPIPTSYKDVQQFLGFANFYRRFIPGYSGTIAPLTGLFKGSSKGVQHAPWQWPVEAQRAFDAVKDSFGRAPLLRHFDPRKGVRVETDASAFAIAAILSQQDDAGVWHPVAFYSKKLSETEGRYQTHDQELMAIWAAFKHWRHYLEGVSEPTLVMSDHLNLTGFMDVVKLNGRQARWAMYLAGFDFEIKHMAGKRNPADAPSRRPDYAPQSEPFHDSLPLITLQRKLALLPINAVSASGVTEWSRDRVLCAPVRTGVQKDDKPSTAEKLKQRIPRALVNEAAGDTHAYGEESWMLKKLIRVLQDTDSGVKAIRESLESPSQRLTKNLQVWSVRDDLLYHEGKLCIPNEESVRQEILRRYHDDPLAGHFGREKTLELLRRQYWWPKMNAYVADYVSSCMSCQQAKPRRHKPYGLLRPLPEPEGPWEDLTMDFITDLPPSKRGKLVYDAVLVIVDRKTKMALYRPTTKTCDARELADILLDSVVSRFGVPKSIVTDRGTLFTSAYWSELCYIARIKKRLSTAFHPQTDGQTERQNQTLIHWLRCYVDEQQSNWANLLPMAEFAHNNSFINSTGCSPFRMLYGYDPHMDLRIDEHISIPSLQDRWTKIAELQTHAKEQWKRTQERSMEYVNRHRKDMEFKVGDKVLLSTKNLRFKIPKKKLWKRFIGPLQVIDRVGSNAYRLQLPSEWRMHNVFNIEYLEPFKGSGEEDTEFPNALAIDDHDEYEIEEVLDKTSKGRHTHYLVKWKGWPSEYNQWLPQNDMGNAKEAIQDFEKGRQETGRNAGIKRTDSTPKRKRGRHSRK